MEGKLMHLKHKMALVAALVMAVSSGARATPEGRSAPERQPGQHLMTSPGMSYCDPFVGWDWEHENGDSSELRVSGRPGARARREAAGAAGVIGTTPEAIERNFIGVVTRNLANASIASRVARLSDRELEAIARHAAQGLPTERAALLKLFATRLDGVALVRVARAFGRAPVDAAVRTYADAETRATFASAVAGLATLVPEGGGRSGGGSYPRPNLNMTLEEIYLEFRTAPVGSLSASASIAETSMYAGTWLYASYKVGQAVGSEIHDLIVEYDPGLDQAIGATVGSMIDNFWLATDAVQQGHFEAAFDALFGFPVTWGSDPFGDWGVSAQMIDYYEWSSTCGY